MDIIIDTLLTVLIAPLQLVLLPIDALLNNIPNIALIPQSISAITQFVGAIPSTIVKLTGASPVLWNLLIVTFVLYLTLTPSISVLKKVWAWVRP